MKGTRTYAVVAAALIALVAVASALATGGTSGGTTTDAQRATAKYRDVRIAQRAGYGLLKDKRGIACIAMDGMPGMGAMGIHYAKSALVANPAIAATSPEALVYQPLPHGKLRLAALEYVVIAKAWNAHHGTPPALFGHRFNYTPAGNRFGLPAFYSLHAWIWKQNPSGEFAMWNPLVKCP